MCRRNNLGTRRNFGIERMTTGVIIINHHHEHEILFRETLPNRKRAGAIFGMGCISALFHPLDSIPLLDRLTNIVLQ